MKTTSSTPLSPIQISNTQVWLRRNITETTDENGSTVFTADEVTFSTPNPDTHEITTNFDSLFAQHSQEISPYDALLSIKKLLESAGL